MWDVCPSVKNIWDCRCCRYCCATAKQRKSLVVRWSLHVLPAVALACSNPHDTSKIARFCRMIQSRYPRIYQALFEGLGLK